MSKTVAASFSWRKKERKYASVEIEAGVAVLGVGGLMWSECGWLFWGCFLEEGKEFQWGSSC